MNIFLRAGGLKDKDFTVNNDLKVTIKKQRDVNPLILEYIVFELDNDKTNDVLDEKKIREILSTLPPSSKIKKVLKGSPFYQALDYPVLNIETLSKEFTRNMKNPKGNEMINKAKDIYNNVIYGPVIKEYKELLNGLTGIREDIESSLLTKENQSEAKKQGVLQALYKNLGLDEQGKVTKLRKYSINERVDPLLKTTENAPQILAYYKALQKTNTVTNLDLLALMDKNKTKKELLDINITKKCEKNCFRIMRLFVEKNFIPIVGPMVALFQSTGHMKPDIMDKETLNKEKLKYQTKYDQLNRIRPQDTKIVLPPPRITRPVKAGITAIVGIVSTSLGIKAVIDSQTRLTQTDERLELVRQIEKRILRLAKLQK
tara:strand:- start:2235 stop:3353 length:1119 start_codon:yes stop_codon:yes gene_type:complete